VRINVHVDGFSNRGQAKPIPGNLKLLLSAESRNLPID
jgi:hypothetical protein